MRSQYSSSGSFGRRSTIIAVLMVAGALAATAASAQMYATSRDGLYGVVDCDNGSVNQICVLPTPSATEIEFDINNGIAWLQTRDGNFTAQAFHPLTCVALSLPIFNGFAFNGLEYVNGILYGTAISGPCAPSELRILNPQLGTSNLVGPTHTYPVSGLAYDEGNGILYGVSGCGNNAGPSLLLTISLADGSSQVVGNTGVTLGSLEFGCDGQLLAGGDNADGGNIYVLDPSNATAALLGPSGLANVTGLTSADMATPTEEETWGKVKAIYR